MQWSSYRATAGRPGSPSVPDDRLGVAAIRREARQGQNREYRKFVQWGIGQKTIWTEVRGQAAPGRRRVYGQDGAHLRKHKDIPRFPEPAVREPAGSHGSLS